MTSDQVMDQHNFQSWGAFSLRVPGEEIPSDVNHKLLLSSPTSPMQFGLFTSINIY